MRFGGIVLMVRFFGTLRIVCLDADITWIIVFFRLNDYLLGLLQLALII